MKKVLKFIGILAGVFVLIVILYAGFIKIAKGDDAASSDPTLEPDIPKIVLTQRNDAYYDFKNLNITSPGEGIDLLTTWDKQKAEKWVTDNQPALIAFDNANKKEVYIDPNIDVKNMDMSNILTSFRNVRQAAKLELVRGKLLAEQGKTDEALTNYMKVMKMGNKLEKDMPTLIQYLVAIAIERMSLKEMKTLIASGKLKNINLSAESQELQNYRDNGKYLGNAFKMEFRAMSNSLPLYRTKCSNKPDGYWNLGAGSMNWLPSSKLSCFLANSYLFKPVQTQKILAQNYQIHINRAKAVCSGSISDYEKQATENNPSTAVPAWKFWFTENAYGKNMVEPINTAYGGIFNRRCLVEKKIDELQNLMK